MSADHGLERQPGIERLADDINTLKKQVSELRTLQLQGNDALNLQFSNVSSTSFSLANNATSGITMTLANTDGLTLFGFPEITIFEGSVSGSTMIGYGNARDANYIVHRSQPDYYTNDGANLTAVISVTNKTGSTQTIYIEGWWRFIVRTAS